MLLFHAKSTERDSELACLKKKRKHLVHFVRSRFCTFVMLSMTLGALLVTTTYPSCPYILSLPTLSSSYQTTCTTVNGWVKVSLFPRPLAKLLSLAVWKSGESLVFVFSSGYGRPMAKKFRKNKSDISYLKTSWAFNVPIHSRDLLAAILCWLATPRVAACFWCFCFQSTLRHCVYVASASQYPSRTCNCARLLIVAK